MTKHNYAGKIKVFGVWLVFVFFLCITAHAHLEPGALPPQLTLKDVKGAQVALSQHADKKATVILFWATWSPNSQKALMRFEEFYKKYKDKGIEIIAVNVNNQTISEEDIDDAKNTVQKLGITFPVAFDKELGTFNSYNIISIPTTVVVSEGKTSFVLPGWPLIEKEAMFDHLLALAGEPSSKKHAPRYKPLHTAIADTNLARVLVKRRAYDKAYPLFSRAIEKDPKYMLAYVDLAELYQLENKNKEAEDTLRKALSINPDDEKVLSELGYLLAKSGRLKDAATALEKAVKANEAYTPAHYYLGHVVAKEGRLKDALLEFDKAIALNPFDPMIYTLRGEAYENNKISSSASADFRKARELKAKLKN
ncbi:MAG: redoxin domain-containing protein [Nitrospirae bacterium]|nr:MAG: redoxin domain-containing protein [Nitrospirota bacterium]